MDIMNPDDDLFFDINNWIDTTCKGNDKEKLDNMVKELEDEMMKVHVSNIQDRKRVVRNRTIY